MREKLGGLNGCLILESIVKILRCLCLNNALTLLLHLLWCRFVNLSEQSTAVHWGGVGDLPGRFGSGGTVAGIVCSLKEPELAQWEGTQFTHWNKMLLLLCAELWNWNINSTIFKKIQQNCASSTESCFFFFVWLFWVYFNWQSLSFVPLLSLALIPFLLPLQELVLSFSLWEDELLSQLLIPKGRALGKGRCDQAVSPWSLCLPTESSVPLQPPNPLFVWTKSVGWSKNFKYLKLKEVVNRSCSSPPRF